MDTRSLLICIGSPRSGLNLLSSCLSILGIKPIDHQPEADSINQLLLQDLGLSPYTPALPQDWMVTTAAIRAKEQIHKLLTAAIPAFESTRENDCRFPFSVCQIKISNPLLVNIWSAAFNELSIKPRFIFMIRHPWETAQSMVANHNLDLQSAHILCLSHIRSTLSALEEQGYSSVVFDQLLADPVSTLDVCLSSSISSLQTSYSSLLNHVQPSLKNHHASNLADTDKETFKPYAKLYDQLRAGQHFSAAHISENQGIKIFDSSEFDLISLPPQALYNCLRKPEMEAIMQTMKDDIKKEIAAEYMKAPPNPYVHNRKLTADMNFMLREFAEKQLKRPGLKKNHLDYLAAKAIQVELNCEGRLATPIQDMIARLLVAECVQGERICILEIGSLYGISLAILYNHIATRFDNKLVVCLDPLHGFYGEDQQDAVLNVSINESVVLRNMKMTNVPESDFKLVKHYSTEQRAIDAAKDINFNVLIIDGDHSYEGVKFDFENYFPLLQSGGYVIFDDYNAKEWPGVKQFIDQDLKQYDDFILIGFISRTAVGQKKMEKGESR